MAIHPGPTNNTKPASIGAGLYNLIAAMVAAGFTIKASGDGIAAYSSTTSVFTAGTPWGSGANGWDNAGAWARVRYPTGTRELMFVRGNTASGYGCWAISLASGFTTGGNATTAPTAADQVMIQGSSLNPANNLQWSNAVDGHAYVNAICDDAAPYNFWLQTFTEANGTDNGGVASDLLAPLSTGTGGTDPDGYIYGWGVNLWSTYQMTLWKGLVAGTMIQHSALYNGFQARADSSGDQYVQGSNLVPIGLRVDLDAGHAYFRGYSQHMLVDYHGLTKVNHVLENFGGTNGNRVLMAQLFAMPWPAGTAFLTA